ncbi:enoyl-CoA hydratase-related protein [Nocardioides hungaricus]
MSDDPVLVERGPIAVITINRPAVFNALNSGVLGGLRAAYRSLAVDPGCRVVVITGVGDRAFSAGADLDEISRHTADVAPAAIAEGQATFRSLETGPIPVIAAVNGLALGGGFELVLACTFPVLSTKAALGLPESGLGLIPGYGGTQRLPRRIGSAAALHVMLTGERLTADRAYQLGLSPVPPVAPERLFDEARAIADSIASKGPRAVSAILQAVRSGEGQALDSALAQETSLAALATIGTEAGEGISAFLQKRPAQFAPRTAPSA